SSLIQWTAQCWEWDHFPLFGSLAAIETDKKTFIGIVFKVETGSSDPSRTPFMYQKTEQELRQEHPHIFTFLKTSFSCLPIGYYEKGHVHYFLPDNPAKIHAFVSPLSHELQALFFVSSAYVPLLFALQAEIFNIDELLLALLSWQARHHFLTTDRIMEFMEYYTLLTGNEYRRLKTFTMRIAHIAPEKKKIY
ncbi:MAG TPA: hypothetical protein VEK38_00480, partial [Candidatus Bathyarchaeia archaeon]|nr:hypothetical protein [Candidatus Bathyarchaeia archaeon]